MLINLDPNQFCNKEYLLNDLKQCINIVEDLKIKADSFKNCANKNDNDIPNDLLQWLGKREHLQEKMQKIFTNAKEEWRSVLPIVPGLMSNYLEILKISNPKEPIFDITLDFIRSLSLCINPKRLNRYWPTEVQWLLQVTEWLETYLEQTSPNENFSSTYVLILWLSSSVKTPFDLKRFDNSAQKPTAQRIAEIIDKNIDNYPFYPVMHLLAGSYYSRSDCCDQLDKFIGKIALNLSPSSTINAKLCSLRILATLFKNIDRLIMLKHVDQIVKMITAIIDDNHEQSVKLCMKIYGRSALVHLKPPEQFKWRYRCGKRVTKLLMTTVNTNNNGDHTTMDNQINQNGDDGNEINLDVELPDYFENLIGILLQNLTHESTTVRFSVAKYLASIGNRLPFQYSDQMLEHIFNLCKPTEDASCWHGSCLAIAEFVRRGYVQIDSLSKVVMILEEALFFEQIKGSFAIGAHVRDAACYICWSMARAYDGQMISQYVAQLAPTLLNVACFDREVNCRRAASAVIQELAGRTQKFPNWIDVIQRTEFHELSQLEHTYVDIGAHFAITYPEFRSAIIENLLFKKCIHWDPPIRRLASITVGKISNKCPFFQQSYFDKFFKHLEDLNELDLNHRHGFIITISYLLNEDESLQKQSNIMRKVYEIFVEQASILQSTPVSFETNFIRESLLIFVEKSIAFLERNPAGLDTIFSFLLDSIKSNDKNELIQSKTIDALLCFMKQIPNTTEIDKYLSRLISLISSNNDHFVASTLARFFSHYSPPLSIVTEKILPSFDDYLNKWFDQEIRRPETIADIACALLALSVNNYKQLNSEMLTKIHSNIIKCLDDHSITKKGDTGLIVRRATIEAIYPYACQICTEKLLQVIKLISSEAASHRNRTFSLSMVQLWKISEFTSKDSEKELEKMNLKQILCSDPSSIEDLDLYQQCIRLLNCCELIPDLWRGFVCVLADPILEKYSKLLIDFIKNAKNRPEILSNFLELAFEKAKCIRLSIPCLISGHLLLTNISTTSQFQDELAKFAWNACERSSNPRKYLLACDIFCDLLSLGKILLSWKYLFVLIGHRLPRVRTYTSVQLYTSILSLDINDGKHLEELEKIGQILQQTDWSDLKEAQNERAKLADLIKKLI